MRELRGAGERIAGDHGLAARQGRYHCRMPFGSVRAIACGGCSIDRQKRTDMENALTLIGVLAFWWVLQVWVLPRFGVPT